MTHHIMIVDDELLVTGFLQATMEFHGYEVSTFNDPLKALAQFEAAPDNVDLVITDQTMPGMSGMELGKKMLAMRPTLPIILCTGFSESASEAGAKAAGLSGFMLKPFKSDVLISMIKNLLGET